MISINEDIKHYANIYYDNKNYIKDIEIVTEEAKKLIADLNLEPSDKYNEIKEYLIKGLDFQLKEYEKIQIEYRLLRNNKKVGELKKFNQQLIYVHRGIKFVIVKSLDDKKKIDNPES
ncbi:hypothetical protein [Mycoplasmopsis arginini]|uniref:hypothetical protein n=1 Tax=Mycoplasmopsis arginini TaxID=2094 RepID=UPI003D056FB0